MPCVFDPFEPTPDPPKIGHDISRVERVRLLLADHHRCHLHWQWDEDSPAAASYRELVTSLADLERERPAHHAFLLDAWRRRPAAPSFWSWGDPMQRYECRGLLTNFPATTQRVIDRVLEAIATQLSQPIELPPWHLDAPADDLEYLSWFDGPVEPVPFFDDDSVPLDTDVSIGRRASRGRAGEDAGPKRNHSEIVGGDIRQLLGDTPGGFEASGVRPYYGQSTQLSAIARDKLERLVEVHCGTDIQSVRRVIRRGRPARADAAVRAAVADAVADLRDTRRVRVDVLAAILQCDPATVWRLRRRASRTAS